LVVVWAKGSVAESAVRQYTAIYNNLYTALCSISLSCIPHTHSRSTTMHIDLLDMSEQRVMVAVLVWA
jgi:hypothetical protein